MGKQHRHRRNLGALSPRSQQPYQRKALGRIPLYCGFLREETSQLGFKLTLEDLPSLFAPRDGDGHRAFVSNLTSMLTNEERETALSRLWAAKKSCQAANNASARGQDRDLRSGQCNRHRGRAQSSLGWKSGCVRGGWIDRMCLIVLMRKPKVALTERAAAKAWRDRSFRLIMLAPGRRVVSTHSSCSQDWKWNEKSLDFR